MALGIVAKFTLQYKKPPGQIQRGGVRLGSPSGDNGGEDDFDEEMRVFAGGFFSGKGAQHFPDFAHLVRIAFPTGDERTERTFQ